MCFDDFDNLDTGRVFYRISINRELSDVFPLICLELWVLGRKTVEVE